MAKILANGGIVHYRSGLSEFGPRALCHSSTFYQPSDPEGTKLLNKTLGRSEYMPYAPIVLDKDVDKLFYRDKKLDKTNQYMTAVLKCKVDTEQYAGAIHCDGTARPQVLYNHSSFAYRLLKKYKQLTGLAMLINTSWNIHGNPYSCFLYRLFDDLARIRFLWRCSCSMIKQCIDKGDLYGKDKLS